MSSLEFGVWMDMASSYCWAREPLSSLRIIQAATWRLLRIREWRLESRSQMQEKGNGKSSDVVASVGRASLLTCRDKMPPPWLCSFECLSVLMLQFNRMRVEMWSSLCCCPNPTERVELWCSPRWCSFPTKWLFFFVSFLFSTYDISGL